MGVTISARTISAGTSSPSGTTETTILEVSGKSEMYNVEGRIDTINMTASETYVIRVYYKVDGTNYRIQNSMTLSGAQSSPVFRTHTEQGKNDCKITIQKSAGTDRTFPYEFFTLDYAVT